MIKTDNEQLVSHDNILAYPWRRFFARSIDIALYGIIIVFIIGYVLRWPIKNSITLSTLQLMLSCLIMLFIEPLLLKYLGTTPGKCLFGLVLRTKENKKLSYFDGLFRTFYVIKDGYGFGVPLYELYRKYVSFKTCSDKKELTWDQGFSYQIKDVKGIRTVGFFASCFLIFSLLYLIGIQSRLPINRGNITAEEYFENCNVFIKQYELNYGKKLSNDGKWIDRDDDKSKIYIQLDMFPEHKVIYSNGQITNLFIEINSDRKIISNESNQLLMAYASLVGSDKSINGFQLFDKKLLSLLDHISNDFEIEKGNFVISRTTRFEGYRDFDYHLFAIDNQEQNYHMLFEIRRK